MLQNLNIIRDCWWVLGSGNTYVTNESNEFSSYDTGLYKSLNSNDSEYIQFHGGSGDYVFRMDESNLNVDIVRLDTRIKSQQPSGTTSLFINGINIGEFGNWTYDTIENNHTDFTLTDEQKTRILLGRTNLNYDYAEIKLRNTDVVENSGVYLYDLQIGYSGDNTWANHQTGLPNINTATFSPTKLSYNYYASWSGNVSDIADPISSPNDSTYIENMYVGDKTVVWSQGQYMPNGGLSLHFEDIKETIPTLTEVTRAQMKLRFSLPQATIDNGVDTFEINGYNSRYKNQDYIEDEELSYIDSSRNPLSNQYGYYLYGAGSGIDSTSFTTYTTELSFLDPFLPSGLLPSLKHANSDMLANMEFQLIGVPSGARLSAAELTIDYKTDDNLALYIAGDVKRVAASSTVDAGTNLSYQFGNGGWHHRGWRLYGPTVIEEETFTNFYSFSEPSGTRTYPETTNTYYFPSTDYDETVYGEYVLNAPEGTYGEAGDTSSLLKEPWKREYYRNPVGSGELTPDTFSPVDITNIKPTFYRHMVYHGASFKSLDTGEETGTLDSDNQCQIYFDNRLSLDTDFTLYFMLYRTYGMNSYGRFFHRGLTLNDGIDEYEIYGDITRNKVRFTIQDANGNDNSVEVDIDRNTVEPILVWFGCGYEADDSGFTTMTLNVHDKPQNYFGRDWKRAQKQFRGYRKQYQDIPYVEPETGNTISIGGPRTAIGTLDRLTFEQQINRHIYLHRISICEFGYANEYIDLDWELTTHNTQFQYDIEQDKDKRFLQTRLANSQYLQTNPSGVNWVVPRGSGAADWSTTYSINLWSEGDTPHSLFNPITTAGTNNIVAPSAIHLDLSAAHSTDHPSGLQLYVDVEFDSGTSDKWKVAHMELTIPSGGGLHDAYAPIDYHSYIKSHINMDDGVIKYSDTEQINVTLTTKYPDIDDTEYYGDFTIHSMNVYFDSFNVAATGLTYLQLYTYGSPTTIPQNPDDGSTDLYVVGHLVKSDDTTDLFIEGYPHIASGDQLSLYTIASYYTKNTNMPLYVSGKPWSSGNDDISLYIMSDSISGGSGVSMMLYTTSNLDPTHRLPLFIDAGTGSDNASMNLFIKNVPSGTNNNIPFIINGPSYTGDNLSLYINGLGETDGAFWQKGNMNLFIARDYEGTSSAMPLYLAQKNVIDNMPLSIHGGANSGESLSLYIYGSGVLQKTLNLYTHGF